MPTKMTAKTLKAKLGALFFKMSKVNYCVLNLCTIFFALLQFEEYTFIYQAPLKNLKLNSHFLWFNLL